jgi:hypothetical protein
MTFDTYTVTCKKCKGSDTLKITPDHTVFYTNHLPIIAARFRPDLKWGFECQCGNDSRVAPEEKDQLDLIVRGGDHSIAHIAKNLKLRNEQRFVMERA